MIKILTHVFVGSLIVSIPVSEIAQNQQHCYQWVSDYCQQDQVDFQHINKGLTKLEITQPTVFIFHAPVKGNYQFTTWFGEVDRWLNSETYLGTLKPGISELIGMEKDTTLYLTVTPPYTVSGNKDVFHPRQISLQINQVKRP